MTVAMGFSSGWWPGTCRGLSVPPRRRGGASLGLCHQAQNIGTIIIFRSQLVAILAQSFGSCRCFALSVRSAMTMLNTGTVWHLGPTR